MFLKTARHNQSAGADGRTYGTCCAHGSKPAHRGRLSSVLGQEMKIQLIQIESPDCFKSSELSKRAVESTKSPKTTHYRVLADGIEVAFASLDRWPEPQFSQMVVYEIFVPQAMRGKGVATAVLSEVEKIAIEEGFQKIHLRPLPLDQQTSQTKLTDWYRNRGYDWDPIVTGDMEKRLQKTGRNHLINQG